MAADLDDPPVLKKRCIQGHQDRPRLSRTPLRLVGRVGRSSKLRLLFELLRVPRQQPAEVRKPVQITQNLFVKKTRCSICAVVALTRSTSQATTVLFDLLCSRRLNALMLRCLSQWVRIRER